MFAVRTAVAAAVVVAASALGATPAFAATTPTPAQATCDRAPWQAAVQGSPNLKPGQTSGVYLWHTSTGFHLAVTHANTDKAVYRGILVASAPMRYTPVRLEGRDTVALSANRRVLTFTFYNYGHIDGVSFHTDCASTLTVSHLTRGATALPATHVFLGAHRVHPARVPFTVHRS